MLEHIGVLSKTNKSSHYEIPDYKFKSNDSTVFDKNFEFSVSDNFNVLSQY